MSDEIAEHLLLPGVAVEKCEDRLEADETLACRTQRDNVASRNADVIGARLEVRSSDRRIDGTKALLTEHSVSAGSLRPAPALALPPARCRSLWPPSIQAAAMVVRSAMLAGLCTVFPPRVFVAKRGGGRIVAFGSEAGKMS
jgi:hypothetical protein